MHLSEHHSTDIKKLYDINNKIKPWVTESILRFGDLNDRSKKLEFFINAAFVSA
jgi:hypothetical protein